MTRDTAAAHAILVLSLILISYAVAALARAITYVADLLRRSRAARPTDRAGARGR